MERMNKGSDAQDGTFKLKNKLENKNQPNILSQKKQSVPLGEE